MTKSTQTFFHDALSFSSKGEKQMSVLFHGVHVGVGEVTDPVGPTS